MANEALNNISHYYEDLNQLTRNIRVTDAAGKRIVFSNGIALAIEMVLSVKNLNSKLIFIGNGGSAAIASHQATDFWKNGGIRALAFNDSSLITCVSNDFGYQCAFEKPIEMFADSGDVLVAISSSGRSESILKGLQAARLRQCKAITLSGFSPKNPLRRMGDLNFYVPSSSYGYVEIIHLSICHCVLDTIIKCNLSRSSSAKC